MSEDLLVSKEGKVYTLTINRPIKRNSLSPSLLENMITVIKDLEKDKNVRILIITGVGEKAFSAGFDISEISTDGETTNKQGQNVLEKALACVCNFPKPVVAKINGFAVGAGLDLAVNCDFRFAVDTARLGITPSKLGVIYHPDGLKRFINLIGISATKQLFYTGKLLNAVEAKEIGLVDQIMKLEEMDAYILRMADELINNAPLSISGHKWIINELMASTMNLNEEQQKYADKITIEAFNSEDLKEGQRAFKEKRKPNFKGM